MPVPTLVAVSNDVFLAASGSPATVTLANCVAGDLIVMQSYIKVSGNFINIAGITNIQDLSGVAGSKTDFATAAVGSASTGSHEIKFGRCTADGTCSYTVDDGGGATPLFARFYRISAVDKGIIVVDNGILFPEVSSTGFWGYGVNTSTSILNQSIVTGNPECLGISIICVNANQALTAYSGAAGGTWVKPVSDFASSSGGAATLGIQTVDMSNKTTVSGGSIAITSAAWSTIDFALFPDIRVTAVGGVGDPFWS